MSVPTIDHRTKTYDPMHAYWMCRASELAYKDEATIEAQAESWGFDRVQHHHTTFTPPFPLQDTQAYTMSSDHMIVLAFRGTEPANIKDWLSDITTPPWPGPGRKGFVHYGFGEALNSVYPQVKKALEASRTNGQTVWITGHSLGGALAMLAGAWLHFEEPNLLADGIITFGQPRVCDRELAAACDKAFVKRTHRFVNNNDIVPHMPPEPAYTHTQLLRYIDSTGKLRDSMPLLGGLADRARGMTADPLAPGSDGIRDHFIFNYIEAMEKNAARS